MNISGSSKWQWRATWRYEETEEGFYTDTKVFELHTSDENVARAEIQAIVGNCPILSLQCL